MQRAFIWLALAALAAGQSFDTSKIAAIQKEFDDWSKANNDRGVKLIVGNAKTGEQQTFEAGFASKGKKVSPSTIYRMGGMTKIMSGMLTAIAFEEGVVKPSDPISKFIPELAASKLTAVSSVNGATVEKPLKRELTFWDCLGMKCGFSNSQFGMGTLKDAATISPADGVLPKLASDKCSGAMTTANGGKLVRAADWLGCRPKIPLISQPGERSYYGYDYDVIGMALAKAYNKDAETLMREKVWNKLGMDSAFMSWLRTGTSPKGDVADLFFKVPPAASFPSGTVPAGMRAGQNMWASDVSTWDASMWNLMGEFPFEVSGDAAYPGVSGFGEGAMMTFEDFAKFLQAVVQKGTGSNGAEVACETTWKRFMSPTVREDEGMGFLPPFRYMDTAGDFSKQSEWRWGFSGRREGSQNDMSGAPSFPYFSESSTSVGQWTGSFGTMFKFDVESGLYGVGGENTVLAQSGSKQLGAIFVKKNFNRWVATLMQGEAQAVLSVPPSPVSFDSSVVAEIQKEFDDWSKANNDRGVKLVVGNAKTGEQQAFGAGFASKGKKVSTSTIYRMGGMTKIMSGMLTAIAFEEGVVKPSDPISKFIPELAASKLTAVDIVNETTVTVPIERELTFWDCLGMKCGFSNSQFGMGTLKDAATISPADGVLPKLASDKCSGAMTTANGGKLVRAADWLGCRPKIPLISQPGERSYYGYDYDVIGMALAKAYNKDAETLMREKVWSKLGMDSAFMSWLRAGTSPKGDVAEIFFGNQWASDVSTWDASMWNLMGEFPFEVSGDATYPGVSGFGEGAMMTFEDFAKFLQAVVRKGSGGNGNRVLGETVWKWFMSPTVNSDEGMGFVPAGRYVDGTGSFSDQSTWKWGFAGKKEERLESKDGLPSRSYFNEGGELGGQWEGAFGTVFKFDVESGLYGVGGENTVLAQSGVEQAGADFVKKNFNRWMSRLAKGASADPLPTPRPVYKTETVQKIQKEFDDWSKANNDRGVKLILGNAKSGKQAAFATGFASKGQKVSPSTIYRMGGMTKIMSGMLTAIAFEEGVVKPSDPISKFIPELAASKLTAVDIVNETTVTVPVERELTFWDCLGMKCGFSNSQFGMGTLKDAATISPADGVLPKLASDKCSGAMTTANGGKLVRAADWLGCRPKIPLISQPGERSYYGYDYDVIGMALAKAYNKDAETLMREKVWSKLGMDSAFMSWLRAGTSPKGDVAEIFFGNQWASDVSTWDASMWNLMGEFPFEVSGDAAYPGVSGFGEGAMMTFEDFAKFLQAVVRKGSGGNGNQVLGETMIGKFMSATVGEGEGVGFLPTARYFWSGRFTGEGTWKWGYEEKNKEGRWFGSFGTIFSFDMETGVYSVGGENTVSELSGHEQLGRRFVEDNLQRWKAMLECGDEDTEAPDTVAPDTMAPNTTAPNTEVPLTMAPNTTAPDTDAPVTLAPNTSAPETIAPTTAPSTDAPSTMAPDTSMPDTLVPGSTASPDTIAPDTMAPNTTAPETMAPDTSMPDTLVPGSTASPDTMTPNDTVSPDMEPDTNETMAPNSTSPDDMEANTTSPDTMAPNSTSPDTAAPDTKGPTVKETMSPGNMSGNGTSPHDDLGAGEEDDTSSGFKWWIVVLAGVGGLCIVVAGVAAMRKRNEVQLKDFMQLDELKRHEELSSPFSSQGPQTITV